MLKKLFFMLLVVGTSIPAIKIINKRGKNITINDDQGSGSFLASDTSHTFKTNKIKVTCVTDDKDIKTLPIEKEGTYTINDKCEVSEVH